MRQNLQMANKGYQKLGDESNSLTEWIPIILAGILVVAVVIFDYDRFAFTTPIGRFVFADVTMVLFVVVTAVTAFQVHLTRGGFIVILSLLCLGITGFFSILYLILVAELPNVGRAVTDSIRYLLYGAVVFCLLPIITHHRNWRIYIQVFVGCYILVLLVAISQSLAVLGIAPFDPLFRWENIRGGGTRIAGTFRWQGPFVLYMGLMLPILVTRTITATNRILKVFYTGLVAGGVLSIFFSGSRIGLLILPFAFLPVVAVAIRSRELISLYPLLFGGVLLVPLVYFEVGAVERAIDQLYSLITSPGEQSRVRIWRQALSEMLDTSLFFGLGPRQTIYIVGTTPHSGYIGFLVERGIFGLLVFVILIVSLVRIAAQLITSYFDDAPLMALCVASMVPIMLVYSIANSAFTGRIAPLIVALILSTHQLINGGGFHHTIE
ncbi:hypothetical protein AArcCO_2732 [Halalkaliarchaeum sp. AArc-CO]|uniref:O-antigen ligase family protein n=1 Tax=Halalkaliarchaeum sp. AArc-CO TaxID=2866381 RepID=UPI00217EEEBC|nr:O-antigen ligase family protein [Halalkaliarchaeum sp. AArc-CO]UWG52010.1 hypothetical protein AArcCO_2732 [Halalkaliarchaeum sp. AArc-CO]